MNFNRFIVPRGRHEQKRKVHKISKNVKIIKLHYYIWNHHSKYIQTSTDMPGIGLEMFDILRILRNKNDLVWITVDGKTNSGVQRINTIPSTYASASIFSLSKNP